MEIKEEEISRSSTESRKSSFEGRKINKLTFVKPETFEKMKTDQGPTISELCEKGYKVVLFFMKTVACPFCNSTLEDIFALYETFYKMNTLIVICYQEEPEVFQQFIKEYSKFEPLYRLYSPPFQEEFKIEHFSILSHILNKNIAWFIGYYNITSYGVNPPLKDFGSKTDSHQQKLLAAIFVVQDNKIVNECRKQDMSDHFDLARIIIDPDNFGIQYNTSLLDIDRVKSPKIKKEKIVKLKTKPLKKEFRNSCLAPSDPDIDDFPLTFEIQDILSNDKYRKYFKTHMVKEYDSENLLFYEEVQSYKNLTKETRIKFSKVMFNVFLSQGSIYELNCGKSLRKKIEGNLDSGNEDLFDELLGEITKNSILPSFERFLKSDLLIEMQKEEHNRKLSFFSKLEPKQSFLV